MPTQSEQTVLDTLRELSANGTKYVTGAECVSHLAAKINVRKNKELYPYIEQEVKAVIKKFYPDASMYTALLVTAPAQRKRIELQPSKLQLQGTSRTVTLSFDELSRLFNIAASIQDLTDPEREFMNNLATLHPWLRS